MLKCFGLLTAVVFVSCSSSDEVLSDDVTVVDLCLAW